MPLSILCVFFLIFFVTSERITVYALSSGIFNEQIEFVYKDKIFIYNLQPNIKKSNIFELNYEINKYNRFQSKEVRKNLLKTMLNLNFSEEVAVNYLFPNLNKKIQEIEKNIEKMKEQQEI